MRNPRAGRCGITSNCCGCPISSPPWPTWPWAFSSSSSTRARARQGMANATIRRPHAAAAGGRSVLIYAAGVVLNDVFDLGDRPPGSPRAADSLWPGVARGRPADRLAAAGGRDGDGLDRDVPRGTVRLPPAVTSISSVTSSPARKFGTVPWAEQLRPGLVGTLLAACVVLYDVGLKRTPLGPAAIGKRAGR